MTAEVEIIKGIPKEQINKFEDRVVYFTAVATREYVKSRSSYPYLTGELSEQEASAPITGTDKEYNLLAGTDYAKYVWNMKSPEWTNPSTLPQWYYTAFNQKGAVLLLNATIRALRSVK